MKFFDNDKTDIILKKIAYLSQSRPLTSPSIAQQIEYLGLENLDKVDLLKLGLEQEYVANLILSSSSLTDKIFFYDDILKIAASFEKITLRLILEDQYKSYLKKNTDKTRNFYVSAAKRFPNVAKLILQNETIYSQLNWDDLLILANVHPHLFALELLTEDRFILYTTAQERIEGFRRMPSALQQQILTDAKLTLKLLNHDEVPKGLFEACLCDLAQTDWDSTKIAEPILRKKVEAYRKAMHLVEESPDKGDIEDQLAKLSLR